MPKYNECSIYESECRNGTCNHNKSTENGWSSVMEHTQKVEFRNGTYYVTRIIEIPAGKLTKWMFLSEEEKRLHEQTPFTANSTGTCTQCGEKLATEADFEKHFIIDDLRYLNLGYCPNKRNTD